MLKEFYRVPVVQIGTNGLNPYFNGTCSKRTWDNLLASDWGYSLNPYFNGTCSKSLCVSNPPSYMRCLNPYFNGTCSKRKMKPIEVWRVGMS